jgi:hypothetical protein
MFEILQSLSLGERGLLKTKHHYLAEFSTEFEM